MGGVETLVFDFAFFIGGDNRKTQSLSIRVLFSIDVAWSMSRYVGSYRFWPSVLAEQSLWLSLPDPALRGSGTSLWRQSHEKDKQSTIMRQHIYWKHPWPHPSHGIPNLAWSVQLKAAVSLSWIAWWCQQTFVKPFADYSCLIWACSKGLQQL